jgi:hypothetical protein
MVRRRWGYRFVRQVFDHHGIPMKLARPFDIDDRVKWSALEFPEKDADSPGSSAPVQPATP